jgi:site-specific DNA-methyltransferase (adenine-specific)
MEKIKSPRNHTLTLDDAERTELDERVCSVSAPVSAADMADRTFCGSLLDSIGFFPSESVDLLIIDPPYNLDKDFGGNKFISRSDEEYKKYLESWFPHVLRVLKKKASIYVCCDWKCTAAIYDVMSEYLMIRNRITWQREKGRGAQTNWKNCTEDIWFATVSDDYYFNADAVRQKRRVIAPYHEDGRPKDWEQTDDGKFRLTCASNFWDDITVPYWSMSENTDHPAQKPEKLIAKLILASSAPDALVFDPFLGSGTTSVTAKKLGRHYCGIEQNREYCRWTEKRLLRAETDKTIQGYTDGLFWERNTLAAQRTKKGKQCI